MLSLICPKRETPSILPDVADEAICTKFGPPKAFRFLEGV